MQELTAESSDSCFDVSQVGRFQLRLHRDMVVANVLQLLRERAGPSWDGKPLRLLRMRDSDIYKV